MMTVEELKEYKILFDFTTYHKGSKFIGRSGEVFVTAKHELSDSDKLDDELLYLCSQAIHYNKPSYKIFMITIKHIIPIQKPNTPNTSTSKNKP